MSRVPHVCRSIAIVVHEAKVLLVTSKMCPGAWVPPGGKLEPRETVGDAAAREVLEESGIPVDVGRLIAYREVWWDDRDVLELYFAARPVEAPSSNDMALETWPKTPVGASSSRDKTTIAQQIGAGSPSHRVKMRKLGFSAKSLADGRSVKWYEVSSLPRLRHFPKDLGVLCDLAVTDGALPRYLGVLDLRSKEA